MENLNKVNIISFLDNKKLRKYEQKEELDIGRMGEKEYLDFINNSKIKRIIFKI